MDSEMNDISLSDFTPYTIVASLEMSDEPKLKPLLQSNDRLLHRTFNTISIIAYKGKSFVGFTPEGDSSELRIYGTTDSRIQVFTTNPEGVTEHRIGRKPYQIRGYLFNSPVGAT